ncbi:MAG: DEAD/DEAH box helicase family protein, partial [Acidobacteria bacterium]|nr:DEAD/DEAH box helicase family protein [Acidobacteriota bacterium]
MELKRYQERVINEVGIFLAALAKEQAAGNRHAALDAWDEAGKHFHVPDQYHSRRNGLNKDLPTFCVRVPTGGGKTLLATQILGQIYRTILKDRNGAGLVLWVVPSDQIYKDTLKRLRDRNDLYRLSLEHAVSRRIELWEKHEIFRLTPGQMGANLNILLLKLASTNRETREQLKFFRDSGGNIVRHFPPEDAPGEHRALKLRVPNLDMLVEDEARGEHLVKTSLGNLVKLYEPPVILDEGHKATSKLARDTIEGFNASVVVELSATPYREANVLIRVSGRELLDEQMIKLPINISNSDQKSWQDCLTQARDKREELARKAAEHFRASGKLIRPIVLVQVERTGKDQRDAEFVHSEDVKEHLIQRLGVPETAIAIKTSEKDDIEDIDLLDEGCPVEWIITKAALQEGWDCPFAYILVSLNNTGSQQSMTQLVGRVLRQPFTVRTPHDDLNQSYVFCLRRKASDITKEVKKALEQEGYEGDAMSVIDRTGEGDKSGEKIEARMRKEFQRYYRHFEGKVYLPLFAVKHGRDYESLDYYRHLLSQVDMKKFDYGAANWDMAEALQRAKDSFYRLDLDQEILERVGEQNTAILPTILEDDDQVASWLVAALPFEYYSFKQLRAVVSLAREWLYKSNPELNGRLGLVKFIAREKLVGLIEQGTDQQTQSAFEELFRSKRLAFALECVEARIEIPPIIELKSTRRLVHDNGEQIQQSLFDYVPDAFNDYEKAVAFYLDRHPKVLWWYRNLIGGEQFYIQGYRRNRVYPDFVIQEAGQEGEKEGEKEGQRKKPVASVLVLESKGKHLKGNEDTNYKRSLADYFNQVGHKVPWQKLA